MGENVIHWDSRNPGQGVLAWWGFSPSRRRTSTCGKRKLNVGEGLPPPAHGLGETQVGRQSAKRVRKLMQAGYGLSYVTLHDPLESYCIHKTVDLKRVLLIGIR